MKAIDVLQMPLEGVQLIEASAGTGKTHTITTLLLRLLVEKRLQLSEILVVTFTNAATAELRERIRARLGEACRAFEHPEGASQASDLARLVAASSDPLSDHVWLSQALGTTDEASVFTIHGLCQRVLEEHAFESGVAFDLELTADAAPLLRQVVEDLWSAELYRMTEAEVSFLDERRVNLEKILALVKVANRGRPPELVPAAAAPVDVGPSLERFLELRRLGRSEWPGARTRVRELLLRSPALNRAKYRPQAVVDWLDRFEALLEIESESTEGWFDECVKLSTSGLKSGCRAGCSPPVDPFFEFVERLCLARADAERQLEDWLLSLYHRTIEAARVRFQERKQIGRIKTFDDLLVRLAEALRGRGGPALAERMRARWRAVLIDEFQDTDPVQYEVFRTVYAGSDVPLFLIGDPKQAIYAFRGADIFAYLEAARDPRTLRHDLVTNYRSDPGLLSAINALFIGHPSPFLLRDIAYVPVEPRAGAVERLAVPGDPASLQILFVSSEGRVGPRGRITKTWARAELPRLIAREIGRALGAGATLEGRPLCASDLAVLTRTNEQAFDVQQGLRDAGIASVLYGDRSVLDSEEAGDLASVLAALSEPSSAGSVRGALITRLFGLDAEALDALGEEGALWDEWIARFWGWHTVATRQGVSRALRGLLRDATVAERLAAQVGGERSLTNVLHLVEILEQAEHVNRTDMPGLVKWFDEVRRDRAARDEMTRDSEQLRLESDEEAVRITTIHGSKGLEFPWVFCPYLWDTGAGTGARNEPLVYHDRADPRRRMLSLRGCASDPDAAEAAREEELAEGLRIVYVALTRAKHRVSLAWGRFTQWEASALGYLLHGPTMARDADDESLLEQLFGLERRARGWIRVAIAADRGTPLPRAAPGEAVALTCRSLEREIAPAWLTSSFSALAAAQGARPTSFGEDYDYDEALGRPGLPPSVHVGDPPMPFSELPPGATTGQLLHSVLEQADFQHGANELLPLIARELDRSGLGRAVVPDPLAQALFGVLCAPLRRGSSLMLSAIEPSRRFSELEFTLPLALHREGSDPDVPPLAPERLARLFDETQSPVVPDDYAHRLARLGFVPLRGFLHGFIDLVFEYEGSWYLADYKSNRLGSTLGDYESGRLAAVMAEHHYVLQYHLYTLALHRLLTLRERSYDYDRHFGGVFYLFLRGLSPERSPECGVYFDRPPRVLIERLSAWCGPVAGPDAPANEGAGV